MLITGAGGSKKSNIISVFYAYCKEFCLNLNASFDSRTIVIIAITRAVTTSIIWEKQLAPKH